MSIVLFPINKRVNLDFIVYFLNFEICFEKSKIIYTLEPIVSSMLEYILGSRLKVRILRMMLKKPKRQYTLSEIAQSLGLSPGSVHFALKDLERYRVLYVRKFGRSKAFAINETHVLYPQLEKLFGKETYAYRDIARDFAARADMANVKNIILFGSVARGDTLTPGDIDILVVHRKGFERKGFDDLANNIMEEREVIISLIYLDESEVKDKIKRFDSFILTVIDEGVVLYGDEKWLKK